MKNRPLLIVLLTLTLLASASCGPVRTPVPTLNFATPDLTLTAIFSVLVTPATDTPLPVMPSAVNTDTPLPDTSTPTISVTPNVETLAPTLTSVAQTALAKITNTPIPTATSTFTPVPTAAPTQPIRSGPVIYAPFLSPAPKLDGSLGDWEGDWISASNVVFGRANRENAADLSSKIKVGWDWNYLYLAVQVTDDAYVQNAKGENLYEGDSLEVLLDVNLAADFVSEGLSSDDYQLGISGRTLSKDDPGEAYLWYPTSSAGSKSKLIIQARPTDTGYRAEVAIPWSVFGMSPKSGQHYGFAFSVSDNDDSTTNVQQSMVSNVPERKLTDPTTWGNLILTP